MTVSTTTSTAQFDPNGVTINFPFAFRFFAATDLKVFWQKPDGTIQLLTLNSNYTVQGAGNNAGGSITTIGTPLPNGLLVVSRIMVATQLTSFRNQGEFFAEIHEDAFDKLVMLVQQTIDSQGRGLTVPVADPLSISLVLPGAVARAGKALGFDESGQPVVSTLSLEQIEQQPALAMDAAEQAEAAAVAAGNFKDAAGTSATASANSAASSATSAQSVLYGAVQLGMSAWGYRAQPFAGHALDDGQELDRAVYPDFAAALDAGLLPTVTQAQWNADPANRACFVAVSSAGKFRMRDLNGVSSGSVVPGGAFLRGGSATKPSLRQDQTQAWSATLAVPMLASEAIDLGSLVVTTPTGIKNATAAAGTGGKYVRIDPSVQTRTGTETAPSQATGAWMTKLFGVITPLGTAEAASLATAYASLASRLSVVEALPRIRRWTSGVLNVVATPVTSAHALGVRPDILTFVVTLKVAIGGWPIGTEFRIPSGTDFVAGTGQFGIQSVNLTASSLTYLSGVQGYLVMTTTGGPQGLNGANAEVRAELIAWS